jgi:transposase
MEVTVWVGIDWADRKHAYSVINKEGQERAAELSSAPEAVHEWVRELRARNPVGRIVVAIEQNRGGLFYALSMYDFLVLVPVNPRAASAYRESLHVSGSKDDPTDAELLREFVRRHLSKLRVWKPDSELTRELALLNEDRRKCVDERTAMTHALADALKQYFPQALEWFGGESSALLHGVLGQMASLSEWKRAKRTTIERLVRKHARWSAERVAELFGHTRRAVPLTEDNAIIRAKSFQVRQLVRSISVLSESIDAYDAEIARCWSQHPDREVFSSFPGAGPTLAPRLATAFGTDRARFREAIEIQQYSGIAPVTEMSGKHRWVHSRWQCPKFLRQSFHEYAQASIPHCAWARAFYRAQRNRGAGHHAAIRALAYRWMRILFRAWQAGETYDDARYRTSLERRGSPIAKLIAA